MLSSSPIELEASAKCSRLDAQSKPVVHISGKHNKSVPKDAASALSSAIRAKLAVASPRLTANCATEIFIYRLIRLSTKYSKCPPLPLRNGQASRRTSLPPSFVPKGPAEELKARFDRRFVSEAANINPLGQAVPPVEFLQAKHDLLKRHAVERVVNLFFSHIVKIANSFGAYTSSKVTLQPACLPLREYYKTLKH